MIVSKQDRLEDVKRALTLIVQTINDRAIDAVEINSATPPFDKIMPTTWSDMRQRGWIEKMDVINSTSYWVTGLGWREAICISGLANDPDFKANIGRLAAVLKDKVKGRRDDTYVYTYETQ